MGSGATVYHNSKSHLAVRWMGFLLSLAIASFASSCRTAPAEVARPTAFPRPAFQAVPLGNVKLKELKLISLKAKNLPLSEWAYEELEAADVSLAGAFCSLKRDFQSETTWVNLVDAGGKVKRWQFPENSGDYSMPSHLEFLSESRVLIIRHTYDPFKSYFFSFDLKTGGAKPVMTGLQLGRVDHVVPLTDGNIAVLSERSLSVVSLAGKTLWSKVVSNSDPSPSRAQLPVTVVGIGEDRSGRVAVCIPRDPSVEFYDRSGGLVSKASLYAWTEENKPVAQYFGYRGRNFGAFEVDRDGSYWLVAGNYVFHVESNGQLINHGRLTTPDGFLPSLESTMMGNSLWVRPDGKGRVWLYDGVGILLVDDSGKVVSSRGRSYADRTISSVSSFALDSRGTPVVVDERTRGIYSIAPDGSLHLVSEALMREDGLEGLLDIDVVKDDNIFVQPSDSNAYPRTLFVLSKEGRLLNRTTLPTTHYGAFVDTDDGPLAEKEEMWLDRLGKPAHKALTPRGEAIRGFAHTWRSPGGWMAAYAFGQPLYLFDPNGTCVGQIPMAEQAPIDSVAYDGSVVIVTDLMSGAFAYTPDGQLLWRERRELGKDIPWLQVRLTPDRKQVVVLEPREKLAWYEYPSGPKQSASTR